MNLLTFEFCQNGGIDEIDSTDFLLISFYVVFQPEFSYYLDRFLKLQKNLLIDTSKKIITFSIL